MKQVAKGQEPADFRAWKIGSDPDWVPSYAALPNALRRSLHSALLDEQGWVCCYCGRRVDLEASHVEHFRPQRTYPDRAVEYENLFVSCNLESDPRPPVHCGHAKGHAFDESLHVSPLEPGCEARFKYTLLGQVLAADPQDRQAAYMKGLLKLDLAFLRNRREGALLGLFDPTFLASASDDELKRLRDAFRKRDPANRLPDFGHVIARYAEQLLG